MRYDRWKLVFMEQRAHQFGVWMEPFVKLRVPLVFDLRMDPLERASVDSNTYYQWMEAVVHSGIHLDATQYPAWANHP
jgi:hypothetical protein